MSAWVPPGLLRAHLAVVADADIADSPWLLPGTALRVRPYAGFGYPICPFTVWRAGRAIFRTEVNTGAPAPPLAVAATGDGAPLQLVSPSGARYGRRTGRPQVVAETPLPGAEKDGGGPVRVAEYAGPLDLEWPIDALGAPFPAGAWWTGASPGFQSATVARRVRQGVSDEPLPYGNDQPRGAFDRAAAAAALLQPWVDAAWNAPATGPHPATASLSGAFPPPAGGSATTTVDFNLSAALSVASLDPASARWWGFATNLPPDVELIVNTDEAQCVAVAAMFALPPATTLTAPFRALAIATKGEPEAARFTAALHRAHPDLGGVAAALTAAGFELVTLWTVAAAAPPPDPPAAPPVVSLPANRLAWTSNGLWKATLTLAPPPGASTGGPVCATRLPDHPLNERLDERQPWRRPLVPLPPAGGGPASFMDLSCPPGPARWAVQDADLWGQWSPAATVTGGPPDPPPMPVPQVTLSVVPAAPVAGNAPASPGTVTVHATIAPPPSGGPPITSMTATIAGATPAAIPLGTGAAVDPTTPGGQQPVKATVTATDSTGRTQTATADVVVHDPRPFVYQASSPVLLFSGRRRPDGRAELDLRIAAPASAPAGVIWTLYRSDEQAFAGRDGMSEPRRWARAAALRSAFSASGARTGFVALPDVVEPLPGGALRVRHLLPCGSRTVQGV